MTTIMTKGKALPRPFTWFHTPSLIHLYRFGNKTSRTLTRARGVDVFHASEGILWNDDVSKRELNSSTLLLPPPYSMLFE